MAAAMIMSLSGCVTAVATRMADAAMGAALESVGIKPPDPNAPKSISITLAAGDRLNATDEGDSLSLVVRLYQLRNDAGFDGLSYRQVGDEAAEKRVLSDDLVSVREITLIPGKTQEFQDTVPADVKVIAVAAQFRTPAAHRWKLAFNREASEETGIAVGFHACAMTVGRGELTQPELASPYRSLTGVRCF